MLLLGGSSLDGDAVVQPDGSLSERRRVPNDAKPGTTTVALATAGGQIVAETPFEILAVLPGQPQAQGGGLDSLVIAIAVLLLVVPALGVVGERARRQRKRTRQTVSPVTVVPGRHARRRRKWVRQHVHAEPHPGLVRLAVDGDPKATPTHTVRLQLHHDAGTQTLEEVA
jgi:hypothetical protein